MTCYRKSTEKVTRVWEIWNSLRGGEWISLPVCFTFISLIKTKWQRHPIHNAALITIVQLLEQVPFLSTIQNSIYQKSERHRVKLKVIKQTLVSFESTMPLIFDKHDFFNTKYSN